MEKPEPLSGIVTDVKCYKANFSPRVFWPVIFLSNSKFNLQRQTFLFLFPANIATVRRVLSESLIFLC